MSLSQKKRCKPKPWHYLQCVSDELVNFSLSITLVKVVSSVYKTLFQNFWGSCRFFLANGWFASVLLFMKSSANSRLWCIHSFALEGVADVTNRCFRVVLYSFHNVSVINCWCFPWSTRSRCVTAPVVSFFLWRFQMVVLDIANVCAMIFHLLSASQLLVFHP